MDASNFTCPLLQEDGLTFNKCLSVMCVKLDKDYRIETKAHGENVCCVFTKHKVKLWVSDL